VRDFTGLAVGTGLFAPVVFALVVEWADDANGQAIVSIAPAAVLAGLAGSVLGPATGILLHRLTVSLRDWPLVLFPAGFPIGFLGGAIPVWAIARSIEQWSTRAHLFGFALGGASGGLVLGAVWVPYLAMRLRGRAGWPVMLLMVLLSPAIGTACIAGTAMVFEWLSSHGYL
jgi:hypothetical protein